MRNIIFCIFLVVMCSCSKSVPNGIITEEILPVYTIIEEPTIEEPFIAELVSVVFMGERITAPGSYEGVPAEYTPVLDDLYLLCELSYRDAILRSEDRSTSATRQMFENANREVRRREYITFSQIFPLRNMGYAIIDLDGDNIPELLIINHSPYSARRTSAICAVFALRNGQLVKIDDSYNLRDYTVLTADGIFYQTTGWLESAWVKAFRLEADMSELTMIFEARAMLSFEESDIPVPYWFKTENGTEIHISENEFNLLFEAYDPAGALPNLDFIPLFPDRVFPAPRPYEAPEIDLIEIEYPQFYESAPIEYKPILDNFYLFAAYSQTEEFNIVEFLMDEIGFSTSPYTNNAFLCYAVVDINNDGILELLLGSSSAYGLLNASPHSIFTLADGEPVLVSSFGARNSGIITVDGTIFCESSGGAWYTHLSSCVLNENAVRLTALTYIYSDYSYAEERAFFVEVIDDVRYYISEEEFSEIANMYYNPPNPINLTLISIAEQ